MQLTFKGLEISQELYYRGCTYDGEDVSMLVEKFRGYLNKQNPKTKLIKQYSGFSTYS